jgi:ferritin-like metal-binding protein YciE
MKTLNDVFLAELADMYDAENQLVKALPKMAAAATSDSLKEAFQSHLEQTKGHVTTLQEVFECFDLQGKGETCEATAGLIEEAEEIAITFKGSPAINAALVCAAQRIEHYEIASYGCLQEWARILGNEEAADLLQEILEEEKHANEALTDLARADCNEQALGKGRKAKPEAAVAKAAANPRKL